MYKNITNRISIQTITINKFLFEIINHLYDNKTINIYNYSLVYIYIRLKKQFYSCKIIYYLHNFW